MGEHGVADTYNNQRKEQEVKRDVSLFHSQRNNLIYFHLTLSTYKCEFLLNPLRTDRFLQKHEQYVQKK